MFSLNSANSVTKIFVIKRARTCYLLCKRSICYQSANRTHLGDTIVKLSLSMFQWFIRFPEFSEITEFNESSASFRKNSTVFSFIGRQLHFKPPGFTVVKIKFQRLDVSLPACCVTSLFQHFLRNFD